MLVAPWLPADEFPDIRSISADLAVPPVREQTAAPGIRVKQQLANWKGESVYHVLFLPEDWRGDDRSTYPILVELAGNGGYRNNFGDESTGRPEDSKLGFGLSGGRQCIWLCLPYLKAAGDDIALQWWGDAPDYNPQPTLDYMQAAIEMVSRDYGGDRSRIILCGFSRGAIACNYLGLHDEEIAKLWKGFFVYSHYDGVRNWPYSSTQREPAEVRLKRLGKRQQFICAEGHGVQATQDYLTKHAPELNVITLGTGFRNHNDAWILRPSLARAAARKWLTEVLATTPTNAE
jgi:dienelactone hydrolase